MTVNEIFTTIRDWCNSRFAKQADIEALDGKINTQNNNLSIENISTLGNTRKTSLKEGDTFPTTPGVYALSGINIPNAGSWGNDSVGILVILGAPADEMGERLFLLYNRRASTYLWYGVGNNRPENITWRRIEYTIPGSSA